MTGMVHSPTSRFNPVTLIFLKIFVMGLAGIPAAYLFDRESFDSIFANKLSDPRFISISLAAIIYSVVIMGTLYYGLGLRRKIVSYCRRDIILLDQNQYRWIWMLTFALVLICIGYLFVQTGGRHPALSALHSSYKDIMLMRRGVGESVNMNVYNLGFKFLLPFNMILALFFLKNRTVYLILSAALFIVMGTFILEKSPVVSIIIMLVMFQLLMSGLSMKRLIFYALFAVLLISSMYFLTRFASNLSSLSSGLSRRILYGEISDLPYYFEAFSETKISPLELLPPYVARLFGQDDSQSASRSIMEYTNPSAVKLGTAGVANSFFVGEAFAVAGIWGVVLSPFLIILNLGFFIFLFSKLRKNIFFVFLFAWLLYKTFEGVFGGISYFTFSGLHMTLLFLLYLCLSAAFVKRVKKNRRGLADA